MTVMKCDVCEGERFVTAMFVTIRGEFSGKHVDAEASIDLCDECKRRFVIPVQKRDTHVRALRAAKS